MSTKASSWRDTLQLAARVKGIELSVKDLEDIEKAGDDSPLAKWVQTHLNHSNALTTEEIVVWQHMCKTRARSLNESTDELPRVPLDEDRLHKTFTALEASTHVIKTHISDIQQQKSLLASYNSRYGLNSTLKLAIQNSYERKQQGEAQQLNFHNVELSANLRSDLRASQERIEKTIRSLPSRTTERLRSDDRTFETLNETLTSNISGNSETASINDDTTPRLHPFNTPIHTSQIQIQTLLSSLRKVTTLRTQLHLQTLYLQTLSSPTPASISRVHDSEINHLQSDLSSLHDSIEDISAMLVQSLHGQNLASTLQRLESIQNDLALRDATHVQETIAKMTRELEATAKKIEVINSYRLVVAEMEWHLDLMEGESSISTQTHQLSVLPLPPPASSSSSSSSSPPSSDLPALSSLLHNLSVSASQPSIAPPLQAFHSQILMSSKSLVPTLRSLFPTVSFAHEIDALSRLDSNVSRAKAAVEAVAARDDNSVESREKFVREWEGKGRGRNVL